MDQPTTQRRLLLAGGVAALLLGACASREQDATAVLREADRAMGGTQLKTLRFDGSGTGGIFGQAFRPGTAWPRLNYQAFARVLDYENGAMREEFVRSRAEPNGGGADPLMGTGVARTTGLLRGGYAWNMAGPNAAPSPAAVSGRTHDLWTSPHGVIKAALKNGATIRSEGGRSIVSFAEPGRFRAEAWLSADGMVERVDSVQPNPVMGDLRTETFYSDYRDFGGVKFPMSIRQRQGGFPVLDLEVKEVKINLPSGIEVPAPVQAFAERVAVERAAEGVWFLAGGSHNSVAIEMKDHLILVESPLYDGRAQAVLAEAKKLAPGKPVRYVINSHHHFDHSGGLRAAAAEGATLVTSELARRWFEQVLANPNSIAPDALAKSGRRVELIGVGGRQTFSDGSRNVEVMMIEDSVHAQGFMMVWLPRERLLIEADAYTPPAPNTPPPAQPNANNLTLVRNVESLKLDVDRILPLHGRIAPMSQLYADIGRR